MEFNYTHVTFIVSKNQIKTILSLFDKNCGETLREKKKKKKSTFARTTMQGLNNEAVIKFIRDEETKEMSLIYIYIRAQRKYNENITKIAKS